ncbi:tail fiber protein [Halomonas coralii]|uniref:phage tail protein n=1 Tax=Modicisalibacter sp. R2A 31.J TaxID=2831898 RepID=UPI001CCC029D|nr:tail fiber protein [Modicisalibacter sp. R2A 31.J]MBZ9557596.1 tail fiber protein [Modicisalibacter sp. R2A 31.J]
MKSVLSVCVAVGLWVGVSSGVEASCRQEGYLSSICWTGANYCPRDHLPADGRLMLINDNPSLFSLIGTRFGGDGRSTFALPDLRGRSVMGTGQGVALGQASGREWKSLTESEMPAHTHAYELSGISVAMAVTVNGAGSDTKSVDGTYFGTPPAGDWYSSTGDTSMATGVATATVPEGHAVTSQSAGASQYIALRPPQITLQACINTLGVYPPRQ